MPGFSFATAMPLILATRSPFRMACKIESRIAPRDRIALQKTDIAIRPVPTFGTASEPRGKGVGWVDALALDARLSSQKRKLARAFIRFAVSAEAYRAVLTPAWNKAPRYLMPARYNIVIDNAPLYPAITAAHAGRATGTARGLNEQLRRIGRKVDCALPIPVDDTETAKECSR